MAWRLDGLPHPVMYLLRAESPASAACRLARMANQDDQTGPLQDQLPILVKVGDIATQDVSTYEIGRAHCDDRLDEIAAWLVS